MEKYSTTGIECKQLPYIVLREKSVPFPLVAMTIAPDNVQSAHNAYYVKNDLFLYQYWSIRKKWFLHALR